MKKRSIKTKVTKLSVMLSVLSIILIAAVSFGGLIIMRTNTIEISGTLGNEAARGSEDALENQAVSQLVSLTSAKTEYADSRMGAIINQVEIISNLAAEIFNNPDDFPDRHTEPPLMRYEDILSAQILFAEGLEGIELYTALSEAAKIGNLNDLLMQSTGVNSSVITSQIGTESGFIIMGDTSAHTKVNMGYLDPRERMWYTNAVAAGDLIWSDVVDDAFGRGLGIVCANPVFDQHGNLRGVVGVSALLTELNETISDEGLGETSYAFALDNMGRMIISPYMTSLEDGLNMLESDDPDTRLLAERMVAGETGVMRLTINGVEMFAAFAPLELLPWSICTVISVDEILYPARETSSTISYMTSTAHSEIDVIIYVILAMFVAIVAISITIAYFISKSLSNKITEPIVHLNTSISKIEGDNLDYVCDITTGDEIEDLSKAFEHLSKELVEHIKNLTQITAEKERIGAELDVATKIQASMLPSIFPAFPERPEFDIFATMIPAKEVGGDFYDFFLIDNDKLCMVMADVSGKGVPAALFMVIAKTLIKNNAQYGKSPKDVFETVNNLLCESNDADMFVTVFMAVLDLSSGKLSYVNAGHNPPLIKRAGGDYEWLSTKPGFILAGMEGISYKQDEITLLEGDTIFMYTDGVTEATNPQDDLFTDPRLLEVANKHKDSDTLENFLKNIKTEIDLFADGAEQADDITMLAMHMTGGSKDE